MWYGGGDGAHQPGPVGGAGGGPRNRRSRRSALHRVPSVSALQPCPSCPSWLPPACLVLPPSLRLCILRRIQWRQLKSAQPMGNLRIQPLCTETGRTAPAPYICKGRNAGHAAHGRHACDWASTIAIVGPNLTRAKITDLGSQYCRAALHGRDRIEVPDVCRNAWKQITDHRSHDRRADGTNGTTA